MVRPLLDLAGLIPDHEQLAEEVAELAAQNRSAPPPLIIQQDEIEWALERIEQVLTTL